MSVWALAANLVAQDTFWEIGEQDAWVWTLVGQVCGLGIRPRTTHIPAPFFLSVSCGDLSRTNLGTDLQGRGIGEAKQW